MTRWTPAYRREYNRLRMRMYRTGTKIARGKRVTILGVLVEPEYLRKVKR